MKQVVILCARCAKNKKMFGVTTEKREGAWHFVWAFKLREDVARREKFDSSKIDGGATCTDEKYPGCPYCGARGFIHCGSCGGICCFTGEENRFTCPHCGNSGEVAHEGWDGISLSGGGF